MTKKIMTAVTALIIAASASAQIGIGLRDTRYVNISYRYKQHWTAKLEHSVYAEKMAYQYVRLYVGWERDFGMVGVNVEPYFGITYNNSYSNEGIELSATLAPLKWLAAEVAVTPHHDSGMGYTTCYDTGLEFRCTRQIAITGGFTNRPEYREPEKRARGGVRLTADNLWVHPELSIPTEGYGKNVRVLVSMGYTF